MYSRVLSIFSITALLLTPIVGYSEVYPIAYYDDGNDKQAVVDLRSRRANGETLTSVENAVLQAASRTGQIRFCKGASSNATLIQVDGRDAILTTAHALIDLETGNSKCNTFEKVNYYPNISFYDERGGPPSKFEKITVKTDGSDPLNLENVIGSKNRVKTEKDFLIFFLENPEISDLGAGRRISQEILPDGTVRGFMKIKINSDEQGDIFLLGLDPKFRDSLVTAYQKCEYRLSSKKIGIYFSCDTAKGTSSSALATMEDGELVLLGINQQGTEEMNVPLPDYLFRNMGTSISNVTSFLDAEGIKY